MPSFLFGNNEVKSELLSVVIKTPATSMSVLIREGA